MNIYRYEFVSACPSNNQQIIYRLEIQTDSMIYVEKIVTAAALQKKAYHENIADAFHKEFGGRQILTAHHHGVDIETRRGFA